MVGRTIVQLFDTFYIIRHLSSSAVEEFQWARVQNAEVKTFEKEEKTHAQIQRVTERKRGG